jgi:hypothetical protein
VDATQNGSGQDLASHRTLLTDIAFAKDAVGTRLRSSGCSCQDGCCRCWCRCCGCRCCYSGCIGYCGAGSPLPLCRNLRSTRVHTLCEHLTIATRSGSLHSTSTSSTPHCRIVGPTKAERGSARGNSSPKEVSEHTSRPTKLVPELASVATQQRQLLPTDFLAAALAQRRFATEPTVAAGALAIWKTGAMCVSLRQGRNPQSEAAGCETSGA